MPPLIAYIQQSLNGIGGGLARASRWLYGPMQQLLIRAGAKMERWRATAEIELHPMLSASASITHGSATAAISLQRIWMLPIVAQCTHRRFSGRAHIELRYAGARPLAAATPLRALTALAPLKWGNGR